MNIIFFTQSIAQVLGDAGMGKGKYRVKMCKNSKISDFHALLAILLGDHMKTSLIM